MRFSAFSLLNRKKGENRRHIQSVIHNSGSSAFLLHEIYNLKTLN